MAMIFEEVEGVLVRPCLVSALPSEKYRAFVSSLDRVGFWQELNPYACKDVSTMVLSVKCLHPELRITGLGIPDRLYEKFFPEPKVLLGASLVDWL